jgi:DNA-binding MarR family transcriptional regulator
MRRSVKTTRARRGRPAQDATGARLASHPRVAASGTAPAAYPLGLALDFFRTLWHLDQGLHVASGAMYRRVGVTGPQRLVLRIVTRYPEITPSTLAGILHLHPSTITEVVKRLVSTGHLHRTVDPRDARRAILTPTARGRALGAESGDIERKIAEVLNVLGERDVAVAETVLRALARALNRE